MTKSAVLPSSIRLPVGPLLVACLSTGSTASLAQSPGPELQVNVWTSNSQWGPSVGAAPNGEFVVAWSSYAQTPGCYGYQGADCNSVLARRVSAAGDPIDGEIQVNSSTSFTQQSPAVARDADGDFVVAWDSDVFLFEPGQIFARIFDAAGEAAEPAFPASGSLAGAQRHAAVDLAADGDFVVVWEHQSLTLTEMGIYGRQFDAAGAPLGDEFAVQAVTSLGQGSPAVAMSEPGSFVVVWEEETSPGVSRISGQRYDELGLPAGGRFPVSTNSGASRPVVAMDGSGGFVVAWQRTIAGEQDVAARRFDASGGALDAEFRVNTYTPGDQGAPAVAVDGAGRFLVVWQSTTQDTSGGGVVAQAFDAQGLRIGGEFGVNAWTTGAQSAPAAVAAGPDQFFVAWQSQGQDGSNLGIFGRTVDLPLFADGFESGNSCDWSSTIGGGCP